MTVNHQVGGSNPSKSAFKVKKIVIGLAYFSFREAVKSVSYTHLTLPTT